MFDAGMSRLEVWGGKTLGRGGGEQQNVNYFDDMSYKGTYSAQHLRTSHRTLRLIVIISIFGQRWRRAQCGTEQPSVSVSSSPV